MSTRFKVAAALAVIPAGWVACWLLPLGVVLAVAATLMGIVTATTVWLLLDAPNVEVSAPAVLEPARQVVVEVPDELGEAITALLERLDATDRRVAALTGAPTGSVPARKPALDLGAAPARPGVGSDPYRPADADTPLPPTPPRRPPNRPADGGDRSRRRLEDLLGGDDQ